MRSPEIRMSREDRALLKALKGKFRAIRSISDSQINHPPDLTVLSDTEASQFANLLRDFIDQSSFTKYSYFIEKIYQQPLKESSLKEIYLSERSKNGRSRAMSTKHWQEFLQRLGLEVLRTQYLTSKMDNELFLKMEKRLVSQVVADENFAQSIIGVVENSTGLVRTVIPGDGLFTGLSAYRYITEIIARLVGEDNNNSSSRTMSSSRISAIAGVLVDSSVMFTTRDWSVAATLSGISSIVALAMLPD